MWWVAPCQNILFCISSMSLSLLVYFTVFTYFGCLSTFPFLFPYPHTCTHTNSPLAVTSPPAVLAAAETCHCIPKCHCISMETCSASCNQNVTPKRGNHSDTGLKGASTSFCMWFYIILTTTTNTDTQMWKHGHRSEVFSIVILLAKIIHSYLKIWIIN